MTPPVTTEALVEALARHLAEENVRGTDREDDFDWSAVTDQAFRMSFIRAARRIFGGPLAPHLAAHQQVTAERDAKADVLAEMKLCAEASAVEREMLLAELARLRAEGEAKDRALKLLLPFVDYAAGEGLMFLGSDDTERPKMDAADICFGVAEALGMELGDPEFLALLEEGQAAIAARAATAREGE